MQGTYNVLGKPNRFYSVVMITSKLPQYTIAWCPRLCLWDWSVDRWSADDGTRWGLSSNVMSDENPTVGVFSLK